MTDLIRKPSRLVALTWLASLVPTAALAQADADPPSEASRQFTVEVIVFRYASSVSAGTEVFVPDPPPEFVEADDEGVRVFGDATADRVTPVPIDADGNPVELDADGNPVVDAAMAGPADFVLLLDDELTMLSTWDRLDRIDAYEPLAHFGWTQWVKPFGEPAGVTVADFGRPVAGLDGKITLYLSRFLHLAVELELDANPNSRALNEPSSRGFGDEAYLEPVATDRYAMLAGPTYYRINEDRIFKSGETRYFDHPRFGVIARIDRVEEPEDDEPVNEPATTGSVTPGR